MSEQKPMPLDEEPITIPNPDDEPLSLVEEEDTSATKVRAIGGDHGLGTRVHAFKRALNVSGQGATRCKVFFSKIAPASLEYMEGQINDWLDSQDAEVKIVAQQIGIMEGKTPVPNLILSLWY